MIDLKEVVYKLSGPINPVGETYTDNARYENLKKIIELTDGLIGELKEITKYSNRGEFSMSRAGKEALNFLHSIEIDV